MMEKKLIYFFAVCTLIFTGACIAKAPFATLDEAESYALSVEQYPPVDNTDWLMPDFTSYYKGMQKGALGILLTWVAETIGLRAKPAWTPQDCIDLLKRMNKLRREKLPYGNVVGKVDLIAGSKLVVWGDVQGAFHSFVRDLLELKQQGILDTTLKIIKPGYVFVFNGDLIDRSAYSLETLCLALRLMEENPDKVFYVRGNHEDRQTWRDYGLKQELIYRLNHLSNEKVPFADLINNVFETLPLALYGALHVHNKLEVFRISHYGRSDKRIDEQKVWAWLQEGKSNALDLGRAVAGSEEVVKIPMIIKGQSRSTVYQETDGLSLLPPDQGATAWTILSSPTETYQKLYHFYNDAFCILSVGTSIYNSLLGLYTQDVRTLNGFTLRAVNVVTGKGVDPADFHKTQAHKEPKEILFGCTLDLSKGLRIQGANVVRGVSARLNAENQKGGINGNILRFIVLDDGYVPHVARNNVEYLMKEYGLNLILCPMGSPTTQAYLDLVRDKKLLVLFPVTGAPVLRAPDMSNMLHFKTSYHNEGRVLVKEAVKKLQKGKFVFFYQNDAFGIGALDGAREELKSQGIAEWKEVPYRRNAVDFKKHIEEINTYNPDAIFFFATSIAAAAFIRQFGIQHLADKMLLGLSDMGESEFKNFVREKGINMVVSNSVPNAKTSELPIVAEYRDAMKRLGYSLDPFSLEGYLGASITIELIKRTSPPFTKERLLTTAQKFKNHQFGGLSLTYDAATKELMRSLWIDPGEGNWIRTDVPTKALQPQPEQVY